MKNVTISLTESLLEQTREYARSRKTSVNGLIQDLLRQTVTRESFPGDFLELAETVKASSKGRKWSRDSLHER